MEAYDPSTRFDYEMPPDDVSPLPEDNVRRYPLGRIAAFLVGVALGHPMVPTRGGVGGVGGVGIMDRFVFGDIFIVITIVLFAAGSLNARGIRWPRYSLAFLVFLLTCGLSVLFSKYLFISGIGAWEIVIYLYLFVFSVALYNMFLDPACMQAGIWGLLIGCLTSCMLAYSVKFAHFPSIPQHSTHLQGTFLNGSQLGVYLFIVAYALLPIFLFRAKHVQKVLICALLIIIPISLLLSSKRSALAAGMVLAVTTLLYVGVVRGRLGKALLISLVSIVAYVVFVHVIFPAIDASQQTYFIQRAEALLPGQATGTVSAHGRVAWQLFQENPVTGGGISMAAFSPHSELEIHNSYLKFIGEGGLLMLFSGLWLFAVLGFRGPRRGYTFSPRHRMMIACYRATYIAVLLMNAWAWGIRRREVWFIMALIEAMKSSYSADERELEELPVYAD